MEDVFNEISSLQAIFQVSVDLATILTVKDVFEEVPHKKDEIRRIRVALYPSGMEPDQCFAAVAVLFVYSFRAPSSHARLKKEYPKRPCLIHVHPAESASYSL